MPCYPIFSRDIKRHTRKCDREVALSTLPDDDEIIGFMCGSELHIPTCRCGAAADFLCDYPVGAGRTCDTPLCFHHGKEVAPDIHYCPGHLKLWEEFLSNNDDVKILKNVTPFRK